MTAVALGLPGAVSGPVESTWRQWAPTSGRRPPAISCREKGQIRPPGSPRPRMRPRHWPQLLASPLHPTPTPEQSLIADIQDKVSSISRSFAAGLIQSVEVNLPENRLIVNLGENWYGLLNEQQDDISQSIFEQVQQLDFKTLQLRDPEGVVVARNPVVGNNMVILHRSRSAEAELLMS